eukprot:gene7862-17370_t
MIFIPGELGVRFTGFKRAPKPAEMWATESALARASVLASELSNVHMNGCLINHYKGKALLSEHADKRTDLSQDTTVT